MIKKIRSQQLKQIAQWYRDRDKLSPTFAELNGAMGYMADDRVAGWLIPTPTCIAIIENLVSNPHTLPSERRMSMNKLTGFLVDTALALGYTTVICASSHPSVDKQAKRLGFKETNLKFYVLTDNDDYENTLGRYVLDHADDLGYDE